MHRLAREYSLIARNKGPSVANAAENKKKQKYDELQNDFIIQPIALETLGGIGQLTLPFLRRLGSIITERSGDRRETSFLRQRLGVAIQRGNAACIMEKAVFL